MLRLCAFCLRVFFFHPFKSDNDNKDLYYVFDTSPFMSLINSQMHPTWPPNIVRLIRFCMLYVLYAHLYFKQSPCNHLRLQVDKEGPWNSFSLFSFYHLYACVAIKYFDLRRETSSCLKTFSLAFSNSFNASRG